MKLSQRLSRSAIDATRFTATSPHAYSKPTPISSSTTAAASNNPRINPQPRRFPSANLPKKPLPPGANSTGPAETPAQKVARLRAARQAEREAQVSKWDKVVVRGRSWADRAHKVTVYSLVTFSIVAAGITVFALTDMILHNRRKREAFYTEQRNLYSARLFEAIETEKAGLPLDEDQTLILNRERARVQAEEAKKQRSWGRSVKEMAFGGLKKDEGESLAVPEVPTEGEILERIGVDQLKVLETAEGVRREESDGFEREAAAGGGILRAVEDRRREGEKEMEARGVTGGPLDHIADGAVEKAKSDKGWLSWGR